jgi:hypothetical protein
VNRYFILGKRSIPKLKVNKRNNTKPTGIDPSTSVSPFLAEPKVENPRIVSSVFADCVPCAQLASDSVEQDWTHYVRIGAYELKGSDAGAIVANAERDGVFGSRGGG